MECDGLPLIMFWLLRGIKVAVTLFCRPSLELLKILKSQLFYLKNSYSLRNETHLPIPKKYQENKNGTPPLLYTYVLAI
jgi:hypothetical protein